MADSRRYGLNQSLDIGQILSEAQHRWLRPTEICEILRNYQIFRLTSDPPYKPLGGSLFLFDRKTLRYFRKDGHNWRKKKDGKTVREAHEKLKAGSVDVLHCYYAHGEDDENFQRRSYWMLDGPLQHIVLVHYREVKEGSRSGIPRLLNADGGIQNDVVSGSAGLVPGSSAQVNSPLVAAQSSYISSPSTANWNGQTQSSEFEDGDSGDEFGVSPLAETTHSSFMSGSLHLNESAEESKLRFTAPMHLPYGSKELGSLIGLTTGSGDPLYMDQMQQSNPISGDGLQMQYGSQQTAGLSGGIGRSFPSGSSIWPEFHNANKDRADVSVPKIARESVTDKQMESTSDPLTADGHGLVCGYGVFSNEHLLSLSRDAAQSAQVQAKSVTAGTSGYLPSSDSTMDDSPKIDDTQQKCTSHLRQAEDTNIGSPMNVMVADPSIDLSPEECNAQKSILKGNLYVAERQEELKKLDSFGRWMNREIGRDCDDSLMTSDSPIYWCPLVTDNNKEVPTFSHRMQLDVDSLGPSLSQDQLFSIIDFSPDWAYSGVVTKVLISGTFLSTLKQPPQSMKWCCMFGEVEVPAEVLTPNALRCEAPVHAPGLVPFYITCSNRLACSEIREFEYRERASGSLPSIDPEEEMRFQIRFAKLLLSGLDKKRQIGCSEENCGKCKPIEALFSTGSEKEWGLFMKACQRNPREALIQRLLKDRLYEWLVCKVHAEGPNILDEEGQGIIHLAAALGYEWALSAIVAAGVSPSFRDAHGRTALHWAAYFGREESVVTLVRMGAAPGAVEDPTSKFPQGQTAADLASNRGHKGIAGYLAEADLTCHLSSLTLKQSDLDCVSGTLAVAGETVQAHVDEQRNSPLEDKTSQLSLRESLAAVRNSTQAAARIQAAFRVQSFIQRQSTKTSDESAEVSNDVIALASLNKTQKVGHFSDSLHSAAVRIQQKFRGWKGRKDFLKIRHRIVKIQAHVRGHQVRKQYKKIVWSVGIVEKAILRWRRKRTGLRGFRVEKAVDHLGADAGKTDEYDFLRMGRRQKVAGVEKALARVQSMARYPEARDQYMRLVQKSKMIDEGNAT